MEKGVPIRSLSRGIAVLQAINRGQSLSMMAIAKTSEVPYPTACRIVQTLVHEGLIEREPARKRYRPTALVQTLAHGFQGHAQLVQMARPHIVELTRRAGWPVSLATHVGHSMIIRDSTHSLTALTFNAYYPGYALPILECASGLAFMSHMADEERADLLNALKLMPKRSTSHVIDLFEIGKFGKVPYQMLRGRKLHPDLIEFGGYIHYMPLNHLDIGKAEARWKDGIFLGI